MTKTHAFETAGLGVAPFRFIGVEEKVFVIPGVMSKPGGACQYCGTGIRWCYWIRSGDGRKFYVGSECVRRTCQPGGPILTEVEKIETRRARLAAAAKKDARLAALATRLQAASAKLAANPDLLTDTKHPAAPGRTMRDYAEWLIKHAGAAGKTRAARLIEAA